MLHLNKMRRILKMKAKRGDPLMKMIVKEVRRRRKKEVKKKNKNQRKKRTHERRRNNHPPMLRPRYYHKQGTGEGGFLNEKRWKRWNPNWELWWKR